MCRTQNTLENVSRLKKEALEQNNQELANKLQSSYDAKIIKMIRPTSVLNLFQYPGKRIEVKEEISRNESQVLFSAEIEGKIEKFSNKDVRGFYKDAEFKNHPERVKKLKKRTGYIFTSLRKLTLDEYLQEVSLLRIRSRRKKQWIKLIRKGRLTCPATGRKVAYCSYDKSSSGSFHYNFYSDRGELFTIDHIKPTSKGGYKMDVNNLQPMIAQYNWSKGDMDNEEYLKQIEERKMGHKNWKEGVLTRDLMSNRASVLTNIPELKKGETVKWKKRAVIDPVEGKHLGDYEYVYTDMNALTTVISRKFFIQEDE